MTMNLKDKLAAKSADLIGGISNVSNNLHEEPKQWEKIHTLDCSRILPNPYQYRMYFSEEKIEELIEAFDKDGQLQPIGVRRVNDNYQIIFGEHRWRAATRRNGKVMAIIREVTDEQMASMCFGENKQRSNPSAYEDYRAIVIQRQMGKTPKEIMASLLLRNQDYYKLDAFSKFPEPVIQFIEKNLTVVGKTEAEALSQFLTDDKGRYDSGKFTDVVLDAMDRFVHGNIKTRKQMVSYVETNLKIKTEKPARTAPKRADVEPKSEPVNFEGKPVGTLTHSSTTLTLSLNKEELPQDKIQEFHEFMEKFLKA